uniref:Helicase C-terminal domain-containing protein n=1 Tax=Glossina austeni TaxID=7395 RepID=A0A1A9UNZ6_GLOAU
MINVFGDDNDVAVVGIVEKLQLLEKCLAFLSRMRTLANHPLLARYFLDNAKLREFSKRLATVPTYKKSNPQEDLRCGSARGKEVAIIYGGLPPGTKIGQAAKFSSKMILTTVAKSIFRIVFYSVTKPTIEKKGGREIDTISVSSALQAAGRAGRYRTQWEHSYVTTYKSEDLPKLSQILDQTPESLKQAGLHPTAHQIELYAYHLPIVGFENTIYSTLNILLDLIFHMHFKIEQWMVYEFERECIEINGWCTNSRENV